MKGRDVRWSFRVKWKRNKASLDSRAPPHLGSLQHLDICAQILDLEFDHLAILVNPEEIGEADNESMREVHPFFIFLGLCNRDLVHQLRKILLQKYFKRIVVYTEEL